MNFSDAEEVLTLLEEVLARPGLGDGAFWLAVSEVEGLPGQFAFRSGEPLPRDHGAWGETEPNDDFGGKPLCVIYVQGYGLADLPCDTDLSADFGKSLVGCTDWVDGWVGPSWVEELGYSEATCDEFSQDSVFVLKMSAEAGSQDYDPTGLSGIAVALEGSCHQPEEEATCGSASWKWQDKFVRRDTVQAYDFHSAGAYSPMSTAGGFNLTGAEQITTTCVYRTDSWDKNFGLGSDDEMCIDFILYYPKVFPPLIPTHTHTHTERERERERGTDRQTDTHRHTDTQTQF